MLAYPRIVVVIAAMGVWLMASKACTAVCHSALQNRPLIGA
jgi:hypothetical protein